MHLKVCRYTLFLVSEHIHQVLDLSHRSTEYLKPGETIINNAEIMVRMDQLAEEIVAHYGEDTELTLVGLLNGAAPTMVYLEQALARKKMRFVETKYMKVKSRNDKLETDGDITVIQDIPQEELAGKNVLLVDDIADSLTTFNGVANLFQDRGLNALATFALLEKPARRRPDLAEFPLDFVGFKIPDIWVEGFGLDSYGVGRGNQNIIFGPSPDARAFAAAHGLLEQPK